MDRLADQAQHELRGRALTKRELGKALASAIPAAVRTKLSDRPRVADYEADAALALTVARLVSHRGVFVIAPRRGNELSFVRTDEWLETAAVGTDSAEARSELVRRFLRAYAPATARDIAWWATGQTHSQARRAHEQDAQTAWERVADELEEVDVDGVRGFVLADDVARLASPPEPRGVRLLPPHDPLLMLRDRDALVREELHDRVWRSHNNPGVVLDAADLVATWTARKQGRRLVVTVAALAAGLSPQQREAVEAEAQPLAPLRGCDAVEVVHA